MGEERLNAYARLIEQLLGCAQGEEAALLEANAGLVDEGLVAVMGQYADWMESQGEGNAGRLRQFAGQLAQGLGLVKSTNADNLDEAALMPLLMAIFKAELENFGTGQQAVHSILAANQTKLHLGLAQTLQTWAKAVLEFADAETAEAIAALVENISIHFQNFPLGSRANNIEIALAGCAVVLSVRTQTANPPMWAQSTMNLAIAYYFRIKGDRAENIEQAIKAYEQVLTVRTQAAMPIDWAQTTISLATAYKNRIKGDRAENMEQAIKAYEQALTVRTEAAMPIKWATTTNNLATAYYERIKGDRAENMERAIKAYEQALTVMTEAAMPIEWAQTTMGLATAYSDRIKGDRSKNIEQAIAFYEQALTVMTQTAMPIEWAQTTNNLATAYKNRIKGDRSENMEQAIAFYEQALRVRTQTAMPIEWAQTTMGLANVYNNRIKGDRSKNIERAIAFYEQALLVTTQTAMPFDWARTTMNLALAYNNRIKGDRTENIEQAIAFYQQALTVMTRTAMPIEWARTTMNLALAYNNRIKGDRAENIERAIAFHEQALLVMTQTAMPFEWAQATMNLANSYADRIKGDRAENIEQAIKAYGQALTVRTEAAMPIEWAETTMNLAAVYKQRIKGDRAKNIEQAIAYYEQALLVMTQTAMPFEWAQATMNLANSYADRIKGDRAENIEQAIKAYEQALTVRTEAAMPIEWAQTTMGLASAYYSRIEGDHAENIEQMIAAYKRALTVRTQTAMPFEWAQTTMNLAVAYYFRIEGDRAKNIEQAIANYCASLTIFEPTRFSYECRITARSLANLYSDQQRWSEAVPIYDQALTAAESLYQSATLLDSKSASLSETANLPHRAAYAFARTRNLSKAVLALEQGRARGLSESLDRDRANLTQLQTLAPDPYIQYQTITQQLRNLEAQQRDRMTSVDRHSITPETLRNEATRLRQELTETIDQIRQQPGYETFLTLPTLEDVQKAVTPDTPLTYLLTTPAGSLALVVTPNDIYPIWLNDFTDTQLTDLIQTWFAAYNNASNDRQTWHNIIDAITQQIWEPLIGPMVQQLKDLGFDRTTLIPTGYISLLPLHAAWTPDKTQPTGRRYALDHLQITYAPNAKSLTAAKAIADRVQANSILAIDNPKQDLPSSEREVQAAIATFQNSTVLRHDQATVEQVRSQLTNVAIAHFACHGTANLREPLQSGLLMSDGLLTLKDIFALNLADTEKGNSGLRLAILSACETGMIGTENADEAISLPTGLLQAGVAAVIASLWAVSDLSTMLLLTKFYDLWRSHQLEPDQALRQAQIWLRDTTNAEKIQALKAVLPEFPDSPPPQAPRDRFLGLPEAIARDLYNKLAWEDPSDRTYAHPFHWAAFSYTGI